MTPHKEGSKPNLENDIFALCGKKKKKVHEESKSPSKERSRGLNVNSKVFVRPNGNNSLTPKADTRETKMISQAQNVEFKNESVVPQALNNQTMTKKQHSTPFNYETQPQSEFI